MQLFFGKYRGKITDNIDPLKLGRVKVKVPDVSGVFENWALPCVPYAGKNVGFLALPPVNSNIWVEFEAGDINSPIWTGCFWGKEELPEEAKGPEVKLLKTDSTIFSINDKENEGGITLQLSDPVTNKPISMKVTKQSLVIHNDQSEVTITDNTITLSCGNIKQVFTTSDGTIEIGSCKIAINNSAINHTTGVAKSDMSNSGINLNLGLGSVEVSAQGVNLDKGALVVK